MIPAERNITTCKKQEEIIGLKEKVVIWSQPNKKKKKLRVVSQNATINIFDHLILVTTFKRLTTRYYYIL
jgi:hypothetical protein